MMVTNDSQGSEAGLIDADGKEAAAVEQAWLELCGQPMDAKLFVRLLGVCDFHAAEATVLWDLLRFHSARGLDSFATRSASELSRSYGGIASERLVRFAVASLEEQGLVELAPVVRNVSRKLRLNWPVLWERLAVVSPLIPGLCVDQSA
jgi:hypothetical protein